MDKNLLLIKLTLFDNSIDGASEGKQAKYEQDFHASLVTLEVRSRRLDHEACPIHLVCVH